VSYLHSKRPEGDASQLPAEQRCVIAINDLFIEAATDGSRAKSDDCFRRSLRVLESYVIGELKRRSVAHARIDSADGHLQEAATILRTMVAADPSDTARLEAWYFRDIEAVNGAPR
jgi:hypothetical protein